MEELERRLREAEETIEAIRTGAVDAIVVSGEKGEQQVFTLEGADSPYRAIIETMSEGAVTLNSDGVILYCNKRFSEILDIPIERLIGTGFSTHCIDGHALSRILRAAMTGAGKGEVHLKTGSGSSVPVYISGNGHGSLGTAASACLMVTDISELTGARDALQKSHDGLERRVEERTAELVRANAALKEEIERTTQAQALGEALNAINDCIHSTLDFETIMRSTMTKAAEALGCDTAHISLRRNGRWVPVYAHGWVIEGNVEMSDEEEPHAVLAIETRTPVAIDDAFSDVRVNRRYMKKVNVRAVLVTPIFSADKAVGVIFFNYHHAPFGFQPFHGDFATKLASSVSLALYNASLVGDLSRELRERRKIEEALRLSEEQFRSVFDNAAIGIVIADTNRRYLAVNDRFCEITGYDRETLLTMGCGEIVHPDDQADDIAEVEALTLGESASFVRELRYMHPSGRTVPVVVNVSVLKHGDSGGGRIIGVVEDITKRKQAEEELRHSRRDLEVRVRQRTTEVRRAFDKLSKERQHLYDVLETMHVMVCLVTADYHMAFANRAFRERFGEDRGRRCFEYVFNKSEPCEFCRTFEVFETGAPHAWELECPDGTVLAVYDYPFNDIDGSPLILEMDIDITEQRRAEKALRLANAYNRSLIEASLDPLVTIDPEGRISDANVATEQVTGWSREELIGKDFSDYFTDPQRARIGYLQVFKEGSVRDYPLDICHRDGHTVPVLYNASVYRNENGQVAGVLAAARDISERQKLEGELRQSHKMEAIGTLAGGIAHDFNNMLAVILGNAELALDDIEDEALRASIGQIVKASKRSRDLVKQILTFSRRSGREPKAVPVVPLLKETHELLRAALPSTISMVLNIRTRSDTVIFGDASEVQQVVVNLANNAAYAMRESGGSLTIGLSSVTVDEGALKDEDMKPGRYLKLTVRDTGTGMTPEVQSRMFDPFFTTKAQGEGTGMGLSVVYGIVRSHNGMVEAESRTGKGTLFTVLLPQWDLSCTASDEKEKSLPGLNGERVLFVDDEPAVVEMAEAMLTRLGCRVIAATDATAAMKAFCANPQAYDVVITDQTMPGMNGVELAKKILSIRHDTPVILCTGYSETVSPERAREVGIREFVMKPITKDEMAQAIQRALEQEGPAR